MARRRSRRGPTTSRGESGRRRNCARPSGHVRAGRSLNRKVWPNGARVAVALTFNVSNSANQLARGDTAVVAMTGGEFGAAQGLPRVLELLDRHDVPATFFVAGVADLVDPQMVPEIVKRKRHEIGLLGWSDENVATIDNAAEESRLLTRAIERLTASAGRKPVGARGPSGTVSLHTMGLLKQAGILYDSSLQARDEPYEVLLEGQPSGIVELPNNVVPQRPALPDLGANGTGAAAVAGADLRNLPRRLRRRLSRRERCSFSRCTRTSSACGRASSISIGWCITSRGNRASGSRPASRLRATSSNRQGLRTDRWAALTG